MKKFATLKKIITKSILKKNNIVLIVIISAIGEKYTLDLFSNSIPFSSLLSQVIVKRKIIIIENKELSCVLHSLLGLWQAYKMTVVSVLI